MAYSDQTRFRTRASLLLRLRETPDNPAAWGQFVERYGPQVHDWCTRWGLQEADAADVTQNVLLQVTKKLSEFQYDPAKRFRGWLKTLTQHAWSDLHRRGASIGSGDTAVLKLLERVDARDDLAQRLQETFDHELLEQAYEEVQARVESRTWRAFLLTAVEGMSGADAARQLGMKVGAVYVAKSKVQRMLQEIVQGCEEEV
jgi:RNA polymerase sigma-70 factor (ECF subfamily)